MKSFKTVLLLVISLFSFASFAQQNYGTIGSFSISSSNLINNKIKIEENFPTTTISYTVSISRSADYSTPNGWKPVNIIISLGSKNSNGVPIYFPTSYKITGADFPSNSGFLTKTFTSVINKASLGTNQRIVLAFTTPDFPFTQAWSDPVYGFQIGNGGTTPTNPVQSISEGDMAGTNNDGRVYIVMDGKLRHIKNYNLFIANVSSSVKNFGNTSFIPYPVGDEIAEDAVLINDTNNGKVYLKSGNIIKYVSSPEVAQLYRLNFNNIQNVSDISIFIVEEPLKLKNIKEGQLIGAGGKTYMVIDGQLRHVSTYDIFVNVFVNSPPIRNLDNLEPVALPIGVPLAVNTRLVTDITDGKVYFQEGNLLRYISSIATANKYSFKISNNIQPISSIAGYAIGTVIQ